MHYISKTSAVKVNSFLKLKPNAVHSLVYTCPNLLHRDSEVQGIDTLNKLSPVSITIAIISTFFVEVTTNASLVEVIGRVGWVHYAWKMLGKQVRVSGLIVVFFPVDARTSNPDKSLYHRALVTLTLQLHGSSQWSSFQ